MELDLGSHFASLKPLDYEVSDTALSLCVMARRARRAHASASALAHARTRARDAPITLLADAAAALASPATYYCLGKTPLADGGVGYLLGKDTLSRRCATPEWATCLGKTPCW